MKKTKSGFYITVHQSLICTAIIKNIKRQTSHYFKHVRRCNVPLNTIITPTVPLLPLLYVLRRKTHVSTPGLQIWNALPYLIHTLCSPFFFQRQSQNLPFLTFLASQVSVEIQSQTTAGLSFVIKTCSFSSSILPLSPTLC